MQKFLISLFVILANISLFAQYPFGCTENWNLSGGSKPSWMGSGTERGIVYGNMGNGARLYVVSRNGGNKIITLNPANGSQVILSPDFSFNTTGQNNQLLAINDIAISEDNKLFVSSVSSTSAGNEWYLHVATSEGTAFTRYDLTLDATNERVGDRIYAIGSWDAGTIQIWAPVASQSSNAKIYIFKTTNQGANWTKQTITLSGSYTNTVGNATIAVYPDGQNFYIAGNGALPRKHDITGAYVANSQISSSRMTSSVGGIKLAKVGNRYFLLNAIYRANPSTNSTKHSRIYVVEVTNTTTTPDSVMAAAPLVATGDVGNSVNCNIAYSVSGNNLTVYLLGTDEGIASYTSTSPLPVEFKSIAAKLTEKGIVLSWQTAIERDAKEYVVEKNLAGKWIEYEVVKAKGNTNQVSDYQIIDKAQNFGKIQYRIKSVDLDGSYKYSDVVEVNVNHPEELLVAKNYPNPFNPMTNITVNLPDDQNLKVNVYNVAGQLVTTIFDGFKQKGVHNFEFNANNLPSGTYICKVQTSNNSKTIKMLLLK